MTATEMVDERGEAAAPVALPRKPEVRAAATVGLVSVLLGALGGIAWGLMAPAQQLVVVTADRGVPLTGESSHEFDSLAMFLCIGGVVGAISAILAWQWRTRRGPILFAGVLIGTAVGGVVMWPIGEWTARLRHPLPHNPQVHQIVSMAPSIGSDTAFYAAPFVAALVIAGLAMLSSRDDLGAEA